jgi:hypothetical protein
MTHNQGDSYRRKPKHLATDHERRYWLSYNYSTCEFLDASCRVQPSAIRLIYASL